MREPEPPQSAAKTSSLARVWRIAGELFVFTASAAIAGSALGALDAATTAKGMRAIVPAIHVGGGAGVVAALVLFPCYLAARWLLSRLRLGRFLTKVEGDRGPLIALHSAVSTALVVALAAGFAARFIAQRFATLNDDTQRERLVALSLLATSLVVLLAQLVIEPAFRFLWRRLDRFRPLPLPSSASLRAFLFLSIPAFACGGLGLLAFRAILPPLTRGSILLALLGVASAVALPLALLRRRLPRVSALVFLSLTIVVCTLSLRTGMRWDRKKYRGIESMVISAQSLTLLRFVTDVDRDGASSLYGSVDCRPTDKNVFPSAIDIPENGIDENCDGADAKEDASQAGELFWGEVPKEKTRRYNVVWFIVDAMRADHTSVFGYEHETTPYLEALGEESLTFSHALSQSSATQLSIPSMLMGIDPGRMRWDEVNGRLQPAKGELLIAERFKKHGYRTGIIANPYFERIPGFLRGYDEITYTTREQYIAPGMVMGQSTSFLERAIQEQQSFFLTVYVAAPHQPYVKHPTGFLDFGNDSRGKYDSEIAAADRTIGYTLETIKSHPEVWENTIVVVVADHGEEFREHGGSGHARTCYIESVHVPLIFRVPGFAAKRVDKRVALIDIVPTLVELVGLAHSPDRDHLDGISLLLTSQAESRVPADRPIFCNIVGLDGNGMYRRRALRTPKYSLLQEVTGDGEIQLFAGSDKGEKKPLSLSGADGEKAAQLRTLMENAMRGNLLSVKLEKLKN